MFNVYELRGNGRRPSDGDKPSLEVPFLIWGQPGDGDEHAALVALRAHVPASVGSMTLTQCRITNTLDPDHCRYEGEAIYGSEATQKETGESTYQFDTTGGTFHITQSKQTINTYVASGTAPDFKGVIGATAEGAEGVDITIPAYAFSETHYIPATTVTDAYKGLLFALTGTVCNATFKGCAAGEGLFLGARGGRRGRGDWEIAFNFAASPNVTGLTIGAITGINKAGWDYLWVRYQNDTAGTGANKILVPVPKVVVVDRVYEWANLASLGIGTT